MKIKKGQINISFIIDIKLKEKFKTLCQTKGMKQGYIFQKLLEEYVKKETPHDEKN